MKKLKNPYASMPGYNCFGCSPVNQSGLKMEFFEQGDEIMCRWKPGLDYQGFHDVLHGGIQSTLIDEIASWLVFVKLDTAGVTSRLTVKYLKPVYISRGQIELKARLRQRKASFATIEIELFDGKGARCSEGIAEYFVFPAQKAKSEFHFPGKGAFYEGEI